MRWLRANLFSSWPSGLATLALVALALVLLPRLADWAIVEAVWRADPAACREAQGACWGFVREKLRFILFGTYPFEEHWRPAAASVVLVAMWTISGWRAAWRPWLAALWAAGLALVALLLWGGLAGLPRVENERWGGLVLTLLLATIGVAGALPLGIALALGRRSSLPVIRYASTVYIELVRGVPLVSVLFLASVMLPLFLPEGVSLDKLLRAQLAIVLFAAAYFAEVVRGGLQSVPRAQEEAAEALGFRYWARMRLVVLPQALAAALPPLVGTVIGLLKDTSLVLIIGLFDLLSTIKVSLQDPAWAGASVEAYLFAALAYFAFCFALSAYGRRLERDWPAARAGRPLEES